MKKNFETLQVGATYKDREGNEVEIVEERHENIIFCFLGSDGELYMANGNSNALIETPADLVELVSLPQPQQAATWFLMGIGRRYGTQDSAIFSSIDKDWADIGDSSPYLICTDLSEARLFDSVKDADEMRLILNAEHGDKTWYIVRSNPTT